MSMFHELTFRGIAPLTVAGALAACGGQVDTVPAGGSGGEGGSGGSGSGTTSTITTTSGDAGGGGSGSIPEAVCDAVERAIVIASSDARSAVAVYNEGTWHPALENGPPAARLATFVDVYHQLGAYWIGTGDDADESHFLRTLDGSTVETYDAMGWAPLGSQPLFAAADFALVGRTAEGTVAAYFDPDAFDWYPWTPAIPFNATSGATTSEWNDPMVVGLGDAHELCDRLIVGGQWTPLHCRADVIVATGGEIPVTRPQVVALPGGDSVVVFYQAAGSTLAATRYYHKEGLWTAPEAITDSAIGIEFAAAAAPSGDVVVGVISTAGAVSALRFTVASGWSKPIAIDQGAVVTGENTGSIAAAPGICGDDALIAYINGFTTVRVARVRGQAFETHFVSEFVEEQATRVSIATRELGPPI